MVMKANTKEPKSNQTNLYYNLHIKKFLKIIAKSNSDSYISMDVKTLCQ